jgi:alkylhydroperoxidase family enzyme
LQGEGGELTEALGRAELDAAPLSENERALLEFVELLTRHAYRNTAEDVQRVRDAGWNDEQIAECVYITALFAFFNRVADAFGLEDPGYRELAAKGQAPVKSAEKGKPDSPSET